MKEERNIKMERALDRAVTALEQLLTAVKEIREEVRSQPEERKDPETGSDVPILREAVKTALIRIARTGREQEVKELLARYNARKLNEVDPKNYAAIFSEAEVMTHG